MATGAVEGTRHHEQQIGKTVEITQTDGRDRIALGQLIGAPTDAARHLAERGGTRAARQDKLLERRQLGIQFIEQDFKRVFHRDGPVQFDNGEQVFDLTHALRPTDEVFLL